jgi:ferric-dicitrate binding protein FerR (iron transport regulator)
MEKYLQERATSAELHELSWWLQSRLYEGDLEQMIGSTWLAGKQVPAVEEGLSPREEIARRILDEERGKLPAAGPVIRMRRYWWFAAACLLVTAGLVFIRPFGKQGSKKATAVSSGTKADKIVAGSAQAMLTLDDGSVIVLNDQQKGRIASQGDAAIFKQDSGVLGYQGYTPAIAYNTLRTPRGGEYQVVLNDGTRVWLNAATSLHFPVSFTGSERVVELDGEAYFEVAPDKNKPFLVKMDDGTTVEVTGTHFNVMAYKDEDAQRTTLLEGAVTVRKNKLNRPVRPGEQAVVNGNAINIAAMSDPKESIAWKNGLLSFNEADLKTIMRQAARWYDVDVSYQGEIPRRTFTGSVNRSSSLNELLKIFELSDIRFTIRGRTILVSG